jgi:hypothetical protein
VTGGQPWRRESARAREAGLRSASTTIPVPVEAEVKALLRIPSYPIAAHLTGGLPAGVGPTYLRRNPVEDFSTLQRFAGPPLRDSAAEAA